MRTEPIRCRAAEPEDFEAVSRQAAASYRAAYRGLMREKYLSSLPDGHWVPILEASRTAGHTCLLAERGEEPVESIVFGWSTADPRPGWRRYLPSTCRQNGPGKRSGTGFTAWPGGVCWSKGRLLVLRRRYAKTCGPSVFVWNTGFMRPDPFPWKKTGCCSAVRLCARSGGARKSSIEEGIVRK